jgi:hypothetical protein
VIFVVPAFTPVTTPVPAPTVALDVLLLVHVPPPGLLLSVVVLPTHTAAVPLIDDGAVVTETIFVAAQPVAVTT